jgi:tetratricopeptide (TPR) repeat protein
MLSQAVDYFQRVLNLQQDNGEIWSALGTFQRAYMRLCIDRHFPGHCYLMQDDLQKAYSAYQHALYSLPNPKVCVRVPSSAKCPSSPDRRIRSYGTESGYSTIAMGPWTMPRRHFRLSSRWTKVGANQLDLLSHLAH